LLAGAVATPLVWLATVPAAGATTTTLMLPDAAEAWYADAPVDLCSSPLGCPPSQVPTSPYPADTLHVGIAAGQETARTYLVPDLTAVPFGDTAVSGTMTLPVGAGTTDGTVEAASARLLACLVTAPVADGVAGSSQQPPAIACATAANGLTYDAGKNVFTLDLTPFLTAWAHGAPEDGIAIVPSATSQPTDAWHVAFNGRHRAGQPHIGSVVTVQVAASDAGVPGPLVPSPAPPAVAAAPAVVPGAPSSLSAPAAPPVVATSPQPASAPMQQVAFTRPFQYPLVFLLPIVLLAGAVFLARLFTRDATPLRVRS
jgi:hypothetical protein